MVPDSFHRLTFQQFQEKQTEKLCDLSSATILIVKWYYDSEGATSVRERGNGEMEQSLALEEDKRRNIKGGKENVRKGGS